MWYVCVESWNAPVSQRVGAILEKCELPWLALDHQGRAALELDEDDERIPKLVALLLRAHGIPADVRDSPDEFLGWRRTYFIGIPRGTREAGDAFVRSVRESGLQATSEIVDDVLVLTVNDHVFATEFVRSFPIEEQRTVIFEHNEEYFRNLLVARRQYGN